jgi:hypothetical protein
VNHRIFQAPALRPGSQRDYQSSTANHHREIVELETTPGGFLKFQSSVVRQTVSFGPALTAIELPRPLQDCDAAAAPLSSLAFLYVLEPIAPARKMNIGLCLALTAIAIPTPLTGLISPALLDLGGVHIMYIVEIGVAMVSLGLVYLLPLASPPRAKVITVMDVVSYLFLAIGLGGKNPVRQGRGGKCECSPRSGQDRK